MVVRGGWGDSVRLVCWGTADRHSKLFQLGILRYRLLKSAHFYYLRRQSLSNMLQIRTEQLRILAVDSERRFQRRLRQHLMRQTPGNMRAIEEELPAALEGARSMGLRREIDLVRYCEVLYRELGTARLSAVPKHARNALLRHGATVEERISGFVESITRLAEERRELDRARNR